MDKSNLDPKMLGSLLILLACKMVCKVTESKHRAWCSSPAVIKPKIWYLDQLLKLKLLDLLWPKVMEAHKPLEVVKDLHEHPPISRLSSMQSMEEAWASKAMDKR